MDDRMQTSIYELAQAGGVLGDEQSYKKNLMNHYGVVVGASLVLVFAQTVRFAISRRSGAPMGCVHPMLLTFCFMGLLSWLFESAITVAYIESAGDVSQPTNLAKLVSPATGNSLLVGATALDGVVTIFLAIFLSLISVGFPGSLSPTPADIVLTILVVAAPVIHTCLTTAAALGGSLSADIDKTFNRAPRLVQCPFTYVSSISNIGLALTCFGLACFVFRRVLVSRLGGERLGRTQSTLALLVALGYATPIWSAIGVAALPACPPLEQTLEVLAEIDGLAYGVAVEVPRFVSYCALLVALGSASPSSMGPTSATYSIGAVPMRPETIADWKPKSGGK
jgi:uncharacterized protein with PQ loop repeat